MRHRIRLATLILIAIAVPLAGASVPPEEPGETARRVRLTLVDGAVTIAVGPLERRDGLVLFRTPDGVLASVREDRVTTVEDVPVPSEPPPGRDPGRDTAFATFVIGNDDLPTGPLSSIVLPTDAPVPGLLDEPVPVPIPTYDTYRDRDGRDETWWRSKVAAIETDRGQAEADRDHWNRRFTEVSGWIRLECMGERWRSVRLRTRCAELIAIREEARVEVEDAEARLRDVDERQRTLSEEARRAGALPGWLR